MNKTHCLTAALAVLLAAPTAVATQTANAQTVQEAAKANAQQMIILSEDFSKMTAGSENNPDLSVNINSSGENVNPDYTQTPGWGAGYVYPAGGMICFQNPDPDEKAAFFYTPVFDASAENGIFFVSFYARLVENTPDYKGLGYNTQDAANNNVIEYGNVSGMTNEWKKFTLRFEQGKQKTRVIFREEYGVKVLLKDFKVYREQTTVGSPNVLRHLYYTGTSFRPRWNKVEGATKYYVNVYKSDEEGKIGEQVVTDFETTDTICTVRNIVPGVIYRYNVTASDGTSKSQPSRYVVLNELQSPTPDDVEIAADGSYTATWEKIPNALFYNYYVYEDRIAENDGEFTLIDEDFNSVTDAGGSKMDWTPGNEPKDIQTQAKGYPKGTNMNGYFAAYWAPLTGGYVMVDGWNYFYDVEKNVQDAETGEDLKRYAKFETPVLNISADSSVKLNVSLWGDYASDDLDKEHNYPEYQVNAIAAIVAFNPETGLYEEVERKHFDLDKKTWKNVECEFSKGYEDAKIVIYATDGPSVLYIDNLKVTQQLKKGDAFATCIECQPGLVDAKASVTLPADYAKKNIYQRVVAVNNHKSLFLNLEYNWYSGPSELQLIHEASETAINDAAADAAAVEVARYAVDGTQLAAPQKGVNIVRMSDGTARKVVVK